MRGLITAEIIVERRCYARSVSTWASRAGSTLPPLTTAAARRVSRQLGGVEQQRGHGNGAAGLGNQARGGDNGAHGGANLRFSDGDDAVDKGLDVGEVALAHALGAQAVGDGAAGQFRAPGDDFAGAKAFRGVAGKLRLDAEDFACGG